MKTSGVSVSWKCEAPQGFQAKVRADQCWAGDVKRLKKLEGKLQRIDRAAVLPAVLHGARVLGTPLSVIRSLRSALRNALLQVAAGSSSTVRFAVANPDFLNPFFAAHEALLTF